MPRSMEDLMLDSRQDSQWGGVCDITEDDYATEDDDEGPPQWGEGLVVCDITEAVGGDDDERVVGEEKMEDDEYTKVEEEEEYEMVDEDKKPELQEGERWVGGWLCSQRQRVWVEKAAIGNFRSPPIGEPYTSVWSGL